MNENILNFKTNESICLPIEVINAFPYLSKLSIIILLELYKIFKDKPTLVFTNYDFKYYFKYSRGTYNNFLKECLEQNLINIITVEEKSYDLKLIFLKTEIGNKCYEKCKSIKPFNDRAFLDIVDPILFTRGFTINFDYNPEV